jgi:hypothetical protein
MLLDSQNPGFLANGLVASPDWVFGATKVKQPNEITETIILTGDGSSSIAIQGLVDDTGDVSS